MSDQRGINEQATTYVFSYLPDDHIDHGLLSIEVQYRGNGRWGVFRRGGHSCLGVDGEWDWEPIPSSREDDWLDTHRFDLETAKAFARQHLAAVMVNGQTIADVDGGRWAP